MSPNTIELMGGPGDGALVSIGEQVHPQDLVLWNGRHVYAAGAGPGRWWYVRTQAMEPAAAAFLEGGEDSALLKSIEGRRPSIVEFLLVSTVPTLLVFLFGWLVVALLRAGV